VVRPRFIIDWLACDGARLIAGEKGADLLCKEESSKWKKAEPINAEIRALPMEPELPFSKSSYLHLLVQ
jgi:hypothetical protein